MDQLTEWQEWYWNKGGREIKARYYERRSASKRGLAKMAEYKRWRRRCIRAGHWPTKPEARP